MIVTDPLKRPSERLIQIVNDYFFPQGFVYKKSLNQYSRTIGNRKEMVSVFYNKTGNLVSATLTWAILFPDLENVYKTIDIERGKVSSQTTLWTDLLNYLHRRNTNDSSSFDLYDKKNFKYDDFSINAGAVELINNYEKYVKPFFEHYKDLRTLETELNKLPLYHHPYIGYGGRQISLGLILSRLFNKEKFGSLLKAYRQYILNDTEELEFKKKMEKYLESTLEYLSSVDINKIILV